jgi:hypothetical protein
MVISSVILYDPGVLTRVAEFFEVTVVNKLQSSSVIERSSWNEQAWSNFLDTYGAGVGLGSAHHPAFRWCCSRTLALLERSCFFYFSSGSSFAFGQTALYPLRRCHAPHGRPCLLH